MNKVQTIAAFAVSLLLLVNLASALTITSVNADSLIPGGDGEIRIEVDNNLGSAVTDVSLVLNLDKVQFVSVGSSEDSINKISKDDSEVFFFKVKAANDIKPGDYQIPYTIFYTQDNAEKQKLGSIGISVDGKTDLDLSVDLENPVVGQTGKISLKIINRGFGDAKFVSVTAFPDSYTLLSDEKVYIGTISSDDFETASFDVIFKKEISTFSALLVYKDFNNKEITQTINLPITVYSQQKAIELGIIKKSNFMLYISVVVFITLAWFLWRMFRKNRRFKKSESNNLNGK